MITTTSGPAPTATSNATSNTTTTTVRVAIRELREATYRAFIAAGASAGEASTVAALTVHTEIHCGAGITAALHELPRVPRRRVPMLRDPQHPERLIDPAGRGPLLRAHAAADLAAAAREPLFLTEMPWNPVIPAALYRTCLDQAVVLAAVEITANGVIGDVAIGYPDGSSDRATDHPATTALLERIGYLRASEVCGAAGVLLLAADRDDNRTGRYSGAELHRRNAIALADGVHVDAAGWSALHAAAALFLVPEQ